MDKFGMDYLKMDINMIISEMVHRHPEVGKTAFLYIPFHFPFWEREIENNVLFQFHFFPMKWNGNGMEKEWKKDGK